jgi:hypothetical protein
MFVHAIWHQTMQYWMCVPWRIVVMWAQFWNCISWARIAAKSIFRRSNFFSRLRGSASVCDCLCVPVCLHVSVSVCVGGCACACVFNVWISRRKIQRARGWVFLEEQELGLRKLFFEDPWDEKDDENSFVFCCYKVLAKSGVQQQQH